MYAQVMLQVQANQAALLDSLQEIKERRDLSAAILQDPSSIQEAAAMQRDGDRVAEMIMREGQKASPAPLRECTRTSHQ